VPALVDGVSDHLVSVFAPNQAFAFFWAEHLSMTTVGFAHSSPAFCLAFSLTPPQIKAVPRLAKKRSSKLAHGIRFLSIVFSIRTCSAVLSSSCWWIFANSKDWSIVIPSSTISGRSASLPGSRRSRVGTADRRRTGRPVKMSVYPDGGAHHCTNPMVARNGALRFLTLASRTQWTISEDIAIWQGLDKG